MLIVYIGKESNIRCRQTRVNFQSSTTVAGSNSSPLGPEAERAARSTKLARMTVRLGASNVSGELATSSVCLAPGVSLFSPEELFPDENIPVPSREMARAGTAVRTRAANAAEPIRNQERGRMFRKSGVEGMCHL